MFRDAIRLPFAPDMEDIILTRWETRGMARVAFTQNIQRHVACRETEAAGDSVREVLDNLFAANPRARSYVLDDQAALRRHMTVFIDGEMIRDRRHLSDPVTEASSIYVFQALSGG
jgi:molybdopterin synthase sulfur carrier subunit